MLTIYTVVCHSTCGTYFESYLQSVNVIAENKEQAIEHVKEWLIQEQREFIYPENKWEVFIVGPVKTGVVNYHYDNDY